jgi:hypothetical protein
MHHSRSYARRLRGPHVAASRHSAAGMGRLQARSPFGRHQTKHMPPVRRQRGVDSSGVGWVEWGSRDQNMHATTSKGWLCSLRHSIVDRRAGNADSGCVWPAATRHIGSDVREASTEQCAELALLHVSDGTGREAPRWPMAQRGGLAEATASETGDNAKAAHVMRKPSRERGTLTGCGDRWSTAAGREAENSAALLKGAARGRPRPAAAQA